jgi:hypothetical protein
MKAAKLFVLSFGIFFLLICAGCGINSPKSGSSPQLKTDNNLFGEWTNLDTTIFPVQRSFTTLDFEKGSNSFCRELYSNGQILIQSVGRWRVSADTLFCDFSSSIWDELSGWVEDGTGTITARYRVDDKLQLCISYSFDKDWSIYHRATDSAYAISYDTGVFMVKAMMDTIFLIHDSVTFTATAYCGKEKVEYYLWSRNSGIEYDTTTTPYFKTAFSIKDTGANVGAVKIVSQAGAVSKPDYFEFYVDPVRPSVSVADTFFYVNQQRYLRANAFDKNGQVIKYIWGSIGYYPWHDSTSSNILKWPDTLFGDTKCYIRVMDNDSAYSTTDTFDVRFTPHIFGTSSSDKCAGLFEETDGSLDVLFYNGNSLAASTALFVVQTDTGGFVKRGPTKLATSLQPSGFFKNKNGNLVLFGTIANSGTKTMGLSEWKMDGTMLWEQSYPNMSVYDVAELPAGGYVISGQVNSTTFQFVGADGAQESAVTVTNFYVGPNNHVVALADGMVVGFNFSPGVVLLKIDYGGAELWRKEVQGSGLTGMCACGTGGYVICQQYTIPGTSWQSVSTSFFNDSNQLWQNIAPNLYNNIEASGTTCLDDEILISGGLENGGNVFLHSMNLSGKTNFATVYQSDGMYYTYGSYIHQGNAAIKAADGNYIIAGTTSGYGANVNNLQIILLKIGASGKRIW